MGNNFIRRLEAHPLLNTSGIDLVDFVAWLQQEQQRSGAAVRLQPLSPRARRPRRPQAAGPLPVEGEEGWARKAIELSGAPLVRESSLKHVRPSNCYTNCHMRTLCSFLRALALDQPLSPLRIYKEEKAAARSETWLVAPVSGPSLGEQAFS